MKQSKAFFITKAAMIAAIYVVLTVTANALNLASGPIQIRISEILTILPAFTPAAIPGLFVGCLLSNIFTGCMPWDVVFGSLATLIGAFGTYFLRQKKWCAAIPPVVANTIIVPFILQYVYHIPDALWFLFLTVGVGELISAGLLGNLLRIALNPYKSKLFT